MKEKVAFFVLIVAVLFTLTQAVYAGCYASASIKCMGDKGEPGRDYAVANIHGVHSCSCDTIGNRIYCEAVVYDENMDEYTVTASADCPGSQTTQVVW